MPSVTLITLLYGSNFLEGGIVIVCILDYVIHILIETYQAFRISKMLSFY